MTVTDEDRDKVVEIMRQAMADAKWLPPQPYRLHVYRLAAALAEEREKARAPFLALADDLEGAYPDEGDWDSGYVSGQQYAAERIREALEAP